MSSLLAVALAFAAPPAAVTLGPAEPLPASLHGFNTYFLMATAFQGMTYDGPQFENAVRTLRPRNLRFPGGTIANNYLWREDSFSEPSADKTGWAGEQLRLFRKLGKESGLAGFARICKRYDLEPVWVLNVYEETPESVRALFDRLDELGLDVRRVEFGNEPYWDGRSFNDVRKYSAACRPLAAALRKSRPEVKIGACFGPLGEGYDYQSNWNVPLGKEDWYDAAVFHDYYGGQGFALEAGAKLPAAALLRPAALVDRAVAALDAAAPGKPVWFTEWNLGSEGIGQWKNTGAELLFLAGVFDRLVARRDRIELACFHNIYESNFGAFYLDQETGEVRTNASWELFRLLGTAFADATELRPVSVAAAGDDLYGFAAADGGDVRLMLVNRGETDRAVTLPADLPADAERLTIRCEPDATLPLSTPLAERSAGRREATRRCRRSPSRCSPPPRPSTRNRRRPPAARTCSPAGRTWSFGTPPTPPPSRGSTRTASTPIDLTPLREKEVAVLKMNLAGLKLAAGSEYAVSFEARADPAGGVIAKAPVAGEPASASTFLQLGDAFTPHRLTFAYDPAANGGAVSFVFPAETLRGAGKVVFRDFKIGSAR